ncbi:hypothetical protein MUY27_13940 [Mucilaginibacter sp. RS28]|uniref:ApeA N-terminal domain-containing protein n=1 Tax=Mucilaginibacter straminoryzae TaxID=2932774 RepID=A0A9X1X9D4_9SPHI|nr:HEPN domain-containing protein [Mucilaginibacter straminoryzae]MCJ8210814.1 hypothetical protein [Mucilaginibacter straminoryzae]
MIDQRTYQGYWGLPGKPQDVAGVLNFTPQSNIELQLLGTLNDDNDIYDDYHYVKLIHGFTLEGKKVTLIDCARGRAAVSFPGYSTINYKPSKILIGVHLNEIETTNFNEVIVEFDLLTKWIDKWGFKKKLKDDGSFSFDYHYPNDIHFSLGEVQGLFTFYGSTQFYQEEEFTSSHKAKVKFISSTGLPVMKLLAYVWHFKKFLTLATESNTFVKNVQLKSDMVKDDDGVRNELVELLYNQRNIDVKKNDKHSMNFLFTYNDIHEQFDFVIGQWYEKKDVLEPIINAIYSSYTERLLYIENRFLDVIQALEVFHRRFLQNTETLKAEYLIKLNSIIQLLNEEQQKLVKEKLSYGYEPGLTARLRELFKLYNTGLLSYVTGDNTDVVRLIRNAVDSRNYYTHYDHSVKRRALKGAELYYASERLKILLLTAILKEIGIEMNTIESLFDRNGYMKYDHLIKARQ